MLQSVAPLRTLFISAFVLLAGLLSGQVRAHGPIAINGNAAEWMAGFGTSGCPALVGFDGDQFFSTSFGCTTSNAPGAEQIWSDNANDQRADHWNGTGNLDLRQFRITMDRDNIYFLLRFTDITSCAAQNIQVAIASSAIASSNAALPDGMETNTSINWFRVVEASTSATGYWTDGATFTSAGSSFCSSSNDLWEIAISRSAMNMVNLSGTFSFSVAVACNTAGVPCEAPGSDVMDAMTTTGPNTFDEVGDGTLNFYTNPTLRDILCASYSYPYTMTSTAQSELVDAIQCANANGLSADVINLNGLTVSLIAATPFANYSGQTGLPQITSNISIRNGTIFHDMSGGGFLFRTFSIASGGTLNLQNLLLSGASAPTPGGAFHNSGTLNVSNSTMHGYDTSNRGGVLYNGSGASANFANALFYDNNAVFAHVMDNVGTVTIVNSTFDKHVSVGGFGAILEGTGYTVRNSILWNPGIGPTQISTGNTVSDSIVKGGYSGGTNILNTSPLFVNEGTNDFRIQLTSPAVNVGVNTYVPADTTDVDGDSNTTELRPDLDLNPRVVAGTVDMGAYERQDALPPDPCAAYVFPYTLAGADNTARVANLRQAIQCANANGSADTIDLNGQSVTMADSFADYSGATSLPQITSNISLQNGTLTRSGASLFRIVSVSAAGSLTLRGTTISNGGGAGYASLGAGIHNLGTTTVINTNIVSNTGNQSVAIYSNNTLRVVNSTIAANSASTYSAILDMSGTATIANTVISGNRSTTSDNISINSGTLTVSNSTVAYNYTATSANNASGAFYKFPSATLIVQNSIIWGNRNSNNSADQIEVSSGSPTVSNSIIEGGIFGSINADPLFVTPIAVLSTPTTAGDFQLNNFSPAIDAGANANVPVDTFDVDGDTNTAEEAPDRALAARRYNDTGVTDTGSGTAPIVDLGAYERQTNSDPCAAINFPYTMTGNTPVELRQAITCANANGTADVINLNGQTITLTDSFADYSGNTGLPQITTSITVRNGTITRTGANEFRFFNVSNTGNLTVRDLTLTNGGGVAYPNNGGTIISVGTASTLTVVNTTISGSRTDDLFNGSAIYSNAAFTIVNSSVVGGGFARGAIASNNGPALIQNTLIAGNSGPSTVNGAGGVYFGNMASATIENSTIVGNYTDSTPATQPGGVFASGGTVNLTIRNSIIWGNRNVGNTAPQVVNTTAGTNTVTSSLIEGGTFGALNSDPLFLTPITASATPTTAGNFRLGDLSPAVDAGANANVPVDTFDVDGDTNTAEEALDRALAARRYNDTGVTDTGSGTAPIVDLGAFEKQTNSTLSQLTLTKTASAASFVVGTPASFTLQLSNTGTAATTAASTITDAIPAGLVIGTLPGACAAAGQTVTCTVPAGLAASGSASFVIPVTPGVATAASITNTATVSGGGDSTCPAAARCSSSVTVAVNRPQLTLMKTASGPSFTVGTPASFTLQLSNTGTAATTAASTITDTIPAGLTLGTLPAGCTAAGQTVTCTVPAGLAASGSTSFVIPVTASVAAPPSVTNTATVSGGGDPSCPAAARCTSSVTVVVNRSELTLTKTASGSSFTVGIPASFTLQLSNTGTAATTAASTITDPIPAGLTIGTLPGGCAAASQTVTCTVAAGLAASGSTSFVIPVSATVAAAASVTNTATVSGGGDATCPANARCTSSVTAAISGSCASISFPYTLVGADNNARVANLRTAIQCANLNGSADLIDLNGQSLVLTDAFANYSGATGLPQITSVLRLRNGAIVRNGAAPQFRLLAMNAAADLTLEQMNLQGGRLGSLEDGGAIVNNSGTLTLQNSFVSNSQAGFSGAIYHENAALRIVDSVVSANTTDSLGVITNAGGSVTIIDSTFAGNTQTTASSSAGVIYNAAGTVTVAGSVFANNSTVGVAGAIQNFGGTVHIANSAFTGNSATSPTSFAGAILNNSGTMTIANSRISGNSAGNRAGALYSQGGALTVSNSTVAGNNAPTDGGITIASGTSTLVNSILWGNSSGGTLTGATVSYSIVQGGFAGTGNLNVDPLFVTPVLPASAPTSTGDYHLQTYSPATDAGSNAAVPVDTLDVNGNANTTEEAPDLDGNPRRTNDTGIADTGAGTAPVVDIGAYERQSNSVVVAATVAPTSLSVSEAGPTSGSFLLSLNAAPTSNVTVQLSFDGNVQVDTGGGFGASPQTVTLTPANALTGVTVNVRAVDDAIVEANPHTSMVVSSATSSTSPGFNGVAVADVSVAITDNDSAGVVISQTGGSSAVSEAGGTDTYTIVLGSQPTATVNVAITFPASDLTLNGDSDGTYDTSFTTGNWNTPQTITIAAINDRALEGNHAGTLTHAFISGDAVYNGITALIDGATASNTLGVSITDNEAGLLEWAPTGASATEGASNATAVRLDITADPVGGTPTLEGTVNYTLATTLGSAEAGDIGAIGGALAFTNVSDLATNAIAIPHLADTLVESAEQYSLGLTLGGAPLGTSASAVPFTGTITDADSATVSLSGTATLSEAVGSTPLTATLNTAAGNTLENAASVAINLVDGTATYAGGAGDYFFNGPNNTLTVNFAAGAGNGATQSAPVNIREDVLVEAAETFGASLGAVTGAISAAGPGATVTINDNESAAVSFQTATSAVGEATTPHSVNALLTITSVGSGTAALTTPLTVAITQTPGTAATPADYTLSTPSVTFAAAAQSAGTQPISIAIVNDAITETNEDFALGFGAVTGTGAASGSHTVTITDNDTPGITVTESGGTTAVAEGGAGDGYTVVLNSQPTADVSINIAFDPAQVILNGDSDGSLSLLFTPAGYNELQTVNVVAVDDTVIETNPHSTPIVQTVSSSDPVYAVINPADVSVSIAENDSQEITFALASSSVAETAGTHVVNARLNLVANGTPGGTLSAAMSANVFLTLASAEIADLSLATTQVSFPPGSAHNAVQPINLTLVNDRLLEDAETGTLSLSLVGSLGSVSGTHGVTLTDDESGAISFTAPSSATNESAGTYSGAIGRLTINGTGTGPLASEASVSVAITDAAGSATTPADYTRSTSTLVFPANAPSPVDLPISASIANDVLIENVESFSFGFGAISGAGALSAAGSHVVGIADNDLAQVAFAPGNDSVGEGAGSFSKPVTLTLTANGVGTASLQNAIVVPVSFTEGTALEPEDFTLATASVSFAAGSLNGAAQNATANLINDLTSEPSESFDLNLGNAFVTANITLGRSVTAVQILDNDTPGVTVTQSGGTTAVTEGGATDTYTIVLTSQPTADVTITVNSGAQLSAVPTPLTFTTANWNVAQTVTVTAVDDAIAEGSHSGTLTHTAASADAVYNGFAIGSVSATITDNDNAGVTVVESGGSTAATEGGATDTYTVVLTSEPTANVAVVLGVGAQVSLSPSNLTFTAANWNVAQTVTVTATDDAVVEGPHNAAITHSTSSSDPNYSAIPVAGISVAITDNDSAVVNFAPASVSQLEGSSPMVFTVTLSAPVASGVTLTLNSANGTAGAADFTPITNATVSFAASSTTPQTVNVAINNDALDENDETFSLALTNLVATGNVTLGTASAAGTILDDDATPTLTISNQSQPEGNAGTSLMTFTVNLSAVSGRDVSFSRATVNGTATVANNDYVALAPQTLSILAGSTSLTIPVTINGDTLFEGNETFTVDLTGISNATPGTLSGTGTIEEDDQQPTTTTITADTPDPTVVGQAYTVTVNVAAQTLSPTGTVTISDGSASCGPVTLAAATSPNSTASCAITSTSAGTKNLIASYTAATTAFGDSVSVGTPHQVNAASTAISVVGPPRSRINQPTTFTFALSVNAPGAGSPAGTVTLSNGAASCNVTVPTATPSCALSFDTLGPRTITAAFAPSNGNFSASSSSGPGNAQTLVYALSDLAVTKTDAVGTYVPGDLLVYTVTVRNLGPDAAANIRVRDNIPAGLTDVLWTCDASGGVACNQATGSGNLDVTIASFPVDGLLNYTFFGNVVGTPAQIVNTALVELPADTTIEDPNPGNNSASDIDLIDYLLRNGFEDAQVNAASGSVRLSAARGGGDEAAVVIVLDDASGIGARVYARSFEGQTQYALATRSSSGALRLGAWRSDPGAATLHWTARAVATGWVLETAEIR